MEEKKVNHKTIQGVVVSDKMDKTITVLVTSKKNTQFIKNTQLIQKNIKLTMKRTKLTSATQLQLLKLAH